MSEKEKGSRTKSRTKSWVRLIIQWLAEEMNPGQGPEKENPEIWEKN